MDAETRTPTQACLEWAMAVPDVPAELFENAVIDDALAALPGRALAARRTPRSAGC